MDAMEMLKARKSVRSYQSKPVPREIVDEMISAGDNAPKAGPFQISVVSKESVLKELDETTFRAMKQSENKFWNQLAAVEGYRPLYGAPLLFVLSAPRENPNSSVNAALAAGNLCNAATALGLGSCYVISPLLAFGAKPELLKEVGVPEGNTVMCGVLAGYAGTDRFSQPKQKMDNVNFCG